MDDGNSDSFEKPQRHEAFFTVVESIVLIGHRGPVKDVGRITKVESVNLEIGSPFALIPTIQYRQIVYTYSLAVNRIASTSTTPHGWRRTPEGAQPRESRLACKLVIQEQVRGGNLGGNKRLRNHDNTDISASYR